MDEYFLLLTVIGIAAFAMVWMPGFTKKTGISYPIIFVLAGIVVYGVADDSLPTPLPGLHKNLTLRLTELIVIISLMGTGIKIDRSFSMKNWASPLKLIFIAMILCIAAAAVLGYTFLNFDLAAALLLGSVLAPTDPVLASDVQVGAPNAGIKSETKFSLTAEAGLNDGMAFPFTWLAITFALTTTEIPGSLVKWFAYDFLYKIIAGIVLGYLFGRGVGYMVFNLTRKFAFLRTRDGFLAVALTFLVYGATELINGYGFIAVFICAITLRHFEKENDYHDDLHSFTDQAERLLIAVVLILFGGAIVSGILNALTWKMVVFSFVFLFVIRPLAAYASLYGAKIHLKEKLAISFFGIRGIGSIYYLAFAFITADFNNQEELWAIVSFTILISIIIHGISAPPIMNHLKARMQRLRI